MTYQQIVSRITQGSPLDGDVGIMVFTPRPDGGTHLDYRIRLSSKIPGLSAIIRAASRMSASAKPVISATTSGG